uniref:Uncharacterized protein n=1 Tax=Tetraselmis sp. GSL018 TaxID=582737 RepID=A0A061RR64_9CHLO
MSRPLWRVVSLQGLFVNALSKQYQANATGRLRMLGNESRAGNARLHTFAREELRYASISSAVHLLYGVERPEHLTEALARKYSVQLFPTCTEVDDT